MKAITNIIVAAVALLLANQIHGVFGAPSKAVDDSDQASKNDLCFPTGNFGVPCGSFD
jgi:hypothetical protein